MPSQVNNCRLFVGNLDFRMLKKQLSTIFGEFGELKDVYLPHNKEADTKKLNQGFGFVEFVNEESAQNAVVLLNSQPDPFFGRTLNVKVADWRKPDGRNS